MHIPALALIGIFTQRPDVSGRMRLGGFLPFTSLGAQSNALLSRASSASFACFTVCAARPLF